MEIYRTPKNKFVASFIGLINLFRAKKLRVEKTAVWMRTNESLDTVAGSLDAVKVRMGVLVAARKALSNGAICQ